MKRIGSGAFRILYLVLFCLVSLGLTLVPSPQVTMAQAATSCDGLTGMPIPAPSIGLPTTGGVVTSATLQAQGTSGEYCKVLGEISPVDPTAPKIKFQVDLPTNWNHKAMAFGGGGFDGSIPSVAGNVGFGPTDLSLYPLARGYATFGSDSGHQAGPLGSQDHLFGLNDEAERNFAVEAPKKTRDAAVFIMKAYYGKKPTKSYFMGGSTGGREALAAIQRWPADWDGAIALYPAWNDMSALLQGQRIMRAMAAPGAYPNQAKRKVIYDAAMAACDALDGIADGIISNQEECNEIFDPNVVRCPGGADTGDTCLSDAQIEALNIYNTPARFHFHMASGLQSFPGCNVWGADLGRTFADSGNYALEPFVVFLTLGTVQPALPATTSMPYLSPFMDQFMKYAVVRDPSGTFNTLSIDPENPGPYAHRISFLSTMLDTSTDISKFVARGGKLLIAHGLQDVLVSTRASELYWKLLQDQFGPKHVEKFARFYLVPGSGHAFGAAFTPGWDSLTALENWVEKGIAPADQVMTDTAVHAGRTRPLCEYPTWPRYNGSGDPNLASSFTCFEERDHHRHHNPFWPHPWPGFDFSDEHRW